MENQRSPVFIGNRYELHETLGEGGMGVVFRATDHLTGQMVALKQVKVGGHSDNWQQYTDDMRMSLAREFEVMASLHHPNIVSVLDYGFDDMSQPYFTMTLLEDTRTIYEVAQTRDVAGKIELVFQVLQALIYLHRRGIVHRDLKPGNVLVNENDQVQLVDFGLAVEREQQAEIVGTLSYMSPEVLRQEPVTSAADLYAVGLMLYELTVGMHPFSAASVTALATEILRKPPNLVPVPGYLQKIVGRLLEKEPRARYASAEEVMHQLALATGESDPEESRAVRESFLQAATFVGRELELARLTGAVSSAIDGRGSSWLVGGESGVGKSRLLSELAILGHVRGNLVVEGQAVEGSAVPYYLWRQPLRQLVLASEVDDFEAGVLKEIIPDIDMLLMREIPDAPELSGLDERQRLILTIIDLFERQKQPVLLILEDLQWATADMEVLKILSTVADNLSLVVVASYRDDELLDVDALFPYSERLKLERLGEAEIVQLSESMLGGVGTHPEVVEFLKQETEGNAFFLVEVVRALAEEAGKLSEVGRQKLPEHVLTGGIQAIIERRLRRVEDWGYALLEVAALVGRQIDISILAELDPDMNIPAWLNMCANAVVLDRVDGVWRFAHDKLREAARTMIPDEKLPELHQKAALAIERAYPGSLRWAAALAHHWGIAGDEQKELDYALVAAENSARVGSFQEASPLYERVLELIPESESVTRLPIMIELGGVYWNTSEFDEAIHILSEARSLAQHLGDSVKEATALFWLGYIPALHGDVAGRGSATEYLQEALRLAQSTKDPEILAKVYYGLGFSEYFIGRMDEAQKFYHRSLEYSRGLEKPTIFLCYALNDLGAIHSSLGDLDKAEECFRQCCEETKQMGSRDYAVALGNLGEIARHRGEYEDAARCYEEAIAISKSMGKLWYVSAGFINLGLNELAQGNAEKAADNFYSGMYMANRAGDGRVIPGAIAGLAGVKALNGDFGMAVEWMGLAGREFQHHPDDERDLNFLIDLLRRGLSEDEIKEGMERGKQLDFQLIVRQILDEAEERAKHVRSS